MYIAMSVHSRVLRVSCDYFQIYGNNMYKASASKHSRTESYREMFVYEQIPRQYVEELHALIVFRFVRMLVRLL